MNGARCFSGSNFIGSNTLVCRFCRLGGLVDGVLGNTVLVNDRFRCERYAILKPLNVGGWTATNDARKCRLLLEADRDIS